MTDELADRLNDEELRQLIRLLAKYCSHDDRVLDLVSSIRLWGRAGARRVACSVRSLPVRRAIMQSPW